MFRLAAGLVLSICCAFAQQVISVHAGVVHHAEGRVLVDGQPLQLGFAKFPILQVGKNVTVEKGRAEILLTPGVFLRVADGSSLQMVKSSFSDAKVELMRGVGMVEVAEIGKDHKVSVKMGDSETLLTKPGLIQFDANEHTVRVYDGKAQVMQNDAMLTLTKSREWKVGNELVASKFKILESDNLYGWSEVRSSTLAMANVRAAVGLKQSGYQMNGSTWAFLPSMGMLTYLPGRGYMRSPFGWSYYGPASVWQYYSMRQDRGYGGGNGGGFGNGSAASSWGGLGSGMSRNSTMSNSSGNSGGFSAPARSSAPAASAPAPSAGGGARGR